MDELGSSEYEKVDSERQTSGDCKQSDLPVAAYKLIFNTDGNHSFQLSEGGAHSLELSENKSIPILILSQQDRDDHSKILADIHDQGKLAEFVQQDEANEDGMHEETNVLSIFQDEEITEIDETSQMKPEAEGIVFHCDADDCGRYFSTKGYLKNHQRAAHGKRQFLQCEFEDCGRTFNWSAHLKYHRMTHLGERLYACQMETCKKRFYTAQRLKVHMRTHTGERPFVCPEADCGKAFTTCGNLKNHKRIHTGEKPFHCSYSGCGLSFAEKSSLKKHAKTHSGDKPYQCSVCQKHFTQIGSRNVHMRRHQLQKAADEMTDETLVISVPTQEVDDSHSSLDQLVVNMDKWDVVVQRHTDDDIMTSYNGNRPIVYSSAIADHIVTVKTEPPASDNIVLGQATVVSEDSQNMDDFQDQVLPESNIGDNVVVLSQPSMTPRSYEDNTDLNEDNDVLLQ